MNELAKGKQETLVVGGGCFWCLEAIFERVKGVLKVESGYAGGEMDNPTYEQVCQGATGHAEVVRITFNPEQVSLQELLEFFWQAHDPTTRNRQGADVGTQYRSIILFQSEEQEKQALAAQKRQGQELGAEIMTEIKPLDKFYKAEEYHQHYFKNNPQQPYCAAVIRPKLAKLGKAKA